jgi:hypothetical protein
VLAAEIGVSASSALFRRAPGHAALVGIHRDRGHENAATIALILLVLWLLGMVSSYTMGGLIHLLLVIAVVVFLVRVIQGRRVV